MKDVGIYKTLRDIRQAFFQLFKCQIKLEILAAHQ